MPQFIHQPDSTHCLCRPGPVVTPMSDPATKSSLRRIRGEDSDSSCLRSIAAGEAIAIKHFSDLVARWQSRLINYFYRSTGNRNDAEDLAQETFLDLYRAAPRYQSTHSFKAFLFTLARRRLIDSYRKKVRRPLSFIDPADRILQEQPDRTNRTREIEEAFHRALLALPDKQRQAILLLQQQELSYEEIAEIMGGRVSAVKSWIHRARMHLREALKEFHT